MSYLEELDDVGHEYRRKQIDFNAYEHYKQIFQYFLTKKYDIKDLFTSVQREYPYYQYNTLTIMKDTDVNNIIVFLNRYLNEVTCKVCFFIDSNSKHFNHRFHTSLLIYNPETRILEHFDSNGIDKYGYYEKFKSIIEGLIDITFINSASVNSLTEYNDKKKLHRSLNKISSIVMGKEFPGFCQLWSLFIYELVNKYQDMTTTEIISCIYLYLRGRKYINACYRARNIIRGYFESLLYDNEIESEELSSYNPTYVLNDIRLNRIIQEWMENKSIDIYIDEN